MANLFAALADLPARAVRERAPGAPPPARLPALERLLARGVARESDSDWRRWALGTAGLVAPSGDLPLARLLAAAHGLDVGPSESWLIASPLKLGAGLNSVHVLDARLDVAPEVAAGLCARFNAEWQGSAELQVAGPALLLREPAELEATTVDPSLLDGLELTAALPRGRDAARLIRRMTEIQMWLHAAGESAFNGLWLWGAGRGALAGTAAWPMLATNDPSLAAARIVHPGSAATPAPTLATWSCAGLLAAGLALTDADARWFEPLEAALARGEVEAAELHFAGRAIRLTGAQRFRWWRRARPWWEFGQ